MKTKLIRPLVVAAAVSSSLMATSMISVAQADTFTGNIGIASKYILRGMTNAPEDDNAALQGGLDYGFDSGFFLGYWGSSLGYSQQDINGMGDSQKAFENDFYGGYGGSIGDFSYSIGLVQYYYLNLATEPDANGMEAMGSVGYGPVTFGFHSLLKDVSWGNKGDTYWTLDYSQPLPKGFTFGASLGAYTYKDSGKYIPASATTESTAFRHLNLSLSHPIGNTGADVGVTYVIGGKDRAGVDQKNAVFFNISYGFDIK